MCRNEELSSVLFSILAFRSTCVCLLEKMLLYCRICLSATARHVRRMIVRVANLLGFRWYQLCQVERLVVSSCMD